MIFSFFFLHDFIHPFKNVSISARMKELGKLIFTNPIATKKRFQMIGFN